MTRHQTGLILASGSVVTGIALFGTLVGTWATPLITYLGVFAIYWIGFCLPVAWAFGRGGSTKVGVHLRAPWWIAALVLMPVIGAATMAGWGAVDLGTPGLLGLGALVALINGPLEELAWRRPFRAQGGGSPGFEGIGLVLFTGWHVSLLLVPGITFTGGAAALLGGAVAFGLIWTWVTRRTGSVGWPIIGHLALNLATFPPLFALNFGG